VEDALDATRGGLVRRAVARRNEAGPDALDGVEHGDVRHLMPPAEHGLAAADVRVDAPQLLVGQVLEGVVAGERVDPAPHQAVAGATDLVLADDPGGARVALRPIALAVVGYLAHRDRAAFEVGDAADHARDVPRHLRRQAGQAVDTGSVQTPHTAEEVTIQRHVPDERLLHQQVAAGGKVVSAAPGLDLAEVVLRDQFPHGVPEVIAGPRSGWPGLGHQRGQQGAQFPPAALAKLALEGERPRQHAVRHGAEPEALQRWLVGERRDEVPTEILAQFFRVPRVRHLQKPRGRLRRQQVDAGLLVGETDRRMGPLINQVVGHHHDVPTALRGLPGELAPVDRGRQVPRLTQRDRAIATGQRRGQHQSAGRERQRDLPSRGVRLGNQQAARRPFRMASQREVARAAGGVAALVVEPKRHARGLGQAHATQEGGPLRLVVHVAVEGDVARKPAEPLRRQRPQLPVLFCGVLLLRVNDAQEPRRRWRYRETIGQRSIFRRQRREYRRRRLCPLAERPQ